LIYEQPKKLNVFELEKLNIGTCDAFKAYVKLSLVNKVIVA